MAEIKLQAEEHVDPAQPAGEIQPDGSVTVSAAADVPKEEKLFAGKYKTAEDMERGYLELQTKLGSPKAPETVVTDAGLDLNALSTEFAQTGELSKASLDLLKSKGVEKSVVDSFIAGQQSIATQLRADLAKAVGGEETLTSALTWAKTNLPADEVAAYDAAVRSGNPALLKMAAASVVGAFNDAVGQDPSLLQGGESVGTRSDEPAFASNRQMSDAINDPRYRRDEAYRKSVERRIAKMP